MRPQDTLLHVLLALVVVIVASRALGWVFRRIGQPAVVGEVLAGVCLGPSLLGRVWPAGQRFLLPAEIAPSLGLIAQVGVILFMFLVGLELDMSLVARRKRATLAIAKGSIVVPLALGVALAFWLYPSYAPPGTTFGVFALFSGVAISVTAFPVLARILTDRGLHKSELGVLALACAAVNDAAAWCLLAIVVGVASSSMQHALVTVGLALAFVAFMLLVARPLVARAVRAQELRGAVSTDALAATFVALLASTLITEWIGIHAIFGAFLLGAVVPHDSRLGHELVHKLEDVVVILFLPAFFAFTGMRTQIGLLDSLSSWLVCGAIVLVASAGKLGGSFVAGRLVGLPARDAAAIGVLMNTRGLMELVVLGVGLDLGIISPALYAMMVVMALVTTIATTPMLRLLRGREWAVPSGRAGRSAA
jgi:Kef-type K+ transport system membrane component KefB